MIFAIPISLLGAPTQSHPLPALCPTPDVDVSRGTHIRTYPPLLCAANGEWSCLVSTFLRMESRASPQATGWY
ncbi:hypothetical protein DENSPDRAFT_839012 [Dentipellis sp. KUC8613]|nr:hypothetical protein DENSPDRAFT_839012 [Dentipellis sp. KUC8613]